MNRTAIIAAIVVVVLLSVVLSNVPDQVVKEKQLSAGPYSIMIRPAKKSAEFEHSQQNGKDVYTYTGKSRMVMVANGRLIVDSMDYGKIKEQDAVVIDRDSVTVNDRNVYAVPLINNEIEDAASIEDVRDDLGGHTLVVRDADIPVKREVIAGKEAIRAGDKVLKIENNTLKVNEKPMAIMNEGDTIFVEKDVIGIYSDLDKRNKEQNKGEQ